MIGTWPGPPAKGEHAGNLRPTQATWSCADWPVDVRMAAHVWDHMTSYVLHVASQHEWHWMTRIPIAHLSQGLAKSHPCCLMVDVQPGSDGTFNFAAAKTRAEHDNPMKSHWMIHRSAGIPRVTTHWNHLKSINILSFSLTIYHFFILYFIYFFSYLQVEDLFSSHAKLSLTRTRRVHVQPCCAKTGDGVLEGMEFLTSFTGGRGLTGLEAHPGWTMLVFFMIFWIVMFCLKHGAP